MLHDTCADVESSGEVMAHVVKLRTPRDVDPALFADWLAQARTLEAG